jgi:hypothetical protein
MGFEKSGGAFFFNGGDFAHSTDIALLKPLNIDWKTGDSMGFHTPKVCSRQKVGHHLRLVSGHPRFHVGLAAEILKVGERNPPESVFLHNTPPWKKVSFSLLGVGLGLLHLHSLSGL